MVLCADKQNQEERGQWESPVGGGGGLRKGCAESWGARHQSTLLPMLANGSPFCSVLGEQAENLSAGQTLKIRDLLSNLIMASVRWLESRNGSGAADSQVPGLCWVVTTGSPASAISYQVPLSSQPYSPPRLPTPESQLRPALHLLPKPDFLNPLEKSKIYSRRKPLRIYEAPWPGGGKAVWGSRPSAQQLVPTQGSAWQDCL